MPNGVRLFLVYAGAILALIGLTMPLVIDQAIEAPVSPIGIVYMLLLAYSIFTITLVLQRKQAAYPLALGLATLSLPLVPIVFLSPAGLPGAVIALALAVILLWGLTRRSTKGGSSSRDTNPITRSPVSKKSRTFQPPTTSGGTATGSPTPATTQSAVGRRRPGRCQRP